MTDHFYDWHTERDRTISAMGGELPNAATEDQVRAAFIERPQITIALMAEVAELKRSGKARSGWAVIRHRLSILNTPELVVTDSSDREAAIRKAERWIRNAGHHFDLEREIEGALFDPGGYLHAWRHDQPLVDRMLELYRREHERVAEPTMEGQS